MAATEEMVAIALKLLPNAACIVPERREELNHRRGLAVAGQQARLSPLIQQLKGRAFVYRCLLMQMRQN